MELNNSKQELYSVVFLDDRSFEEYEKFLNRNDSSIFYYSVTYKNLLENYLLCKSFYLICKDANHNMVGVLPVIYKDSKYGKIANSLPFYGSNGGILLSDILLKEEKIRVVNELVNSFNSIIQKLGIESYTFISNPLDPNLAKLLSESLIHDLTDFRIGQITCFNEQDKLNPEEILKKFDDPRPRNIRKAIKSDVTVACSNSKEDMEFLYKVHKDNIEAIEGIAKDWKFFEKVLEYVPEDQFKIWIAKKDGQKIAGLLLFYFNRTVEYFTPATIHEFRNLQPSALLIFEAMKDALSKGFDKWNWGGTWKTQTGVYDFKRKWGAEDFQYNYYINACNKHLSLPKEELLKEYPYFYVAPFDKLK